MAGGAVNSWQSKLASKLMNYKGNWLRENRGSLMTVAALIVTVTLQPAIAPPGGVWQNHTYPKYTDDENSMLTKLPPNSHADEDCAPGGECQAGTAILGYPDSFYDPFALFIVFDTVSFMTSLVVLFLLIIGLPRENSKVTTWILTIAVCISLSSLGFTFVFGMLCVLPGDSIFGSDVGYTSFLSWIVLVSIGALVIFLLVSVQLIQWFVRKYHVVGDIINQAGHAHA